MLGLDDWFFELLLLRGEIVLNNPLPAFGGVYIRRELPHYERMERITEQMIAQQRAQIADGLEHVRAMALTYKADADRIDKLEQMAKARAAKAGMVPTFALDVDGEIIVWNLFPDDPLETGHFRTMREAIDAAPEVK